MWPTVWTTMWTIVWTTMWTTVWTTMWTIMWTTTGQQQYFLPTHLLTAIDAPVFHSSRMKSGKTLVGFISITSPISSCVTNKGTQILLLLPKRLLWEMQPIFSGENMFNHLYHHTLSYIFMFMQYAYVYYYVLLPILSAILTMKIYELFLLP